MSHTPGPWEIVRLEGKLDDWTGSSIVLRAKAAPGGICAIIGGLGEEEEDTARLIKAAPQLLKALKGAVGNLRMAQVLMDSASRALCQSMLKDYEAVIAEATGGAS